MPPITHADLDNWFTYHSPKGDQPDRYEGIRNRARDLAAYFVTASRPSADQTAALRKLRETVMAMNSTIACNEQELTMYEDIDPFGDNPWYGWYGWLRAILGWFEQLLVRMPFERVKPIDFAWILNLVLELKRKVRKLG